MRTDCAWVHFRGEQMSSVGSPPPGTQHVDGPAQHQLSLVGSLFDCTCPSARVLYLYQPLWCLYKTAAVDDPTLNLEPLEASVVMPGC